LKPPDALLSALNQVAQGKPFPWVWLATFEAQVRIVRVLSYNWVQGTLTFAAHADHDCLSQIRQNSRGQICLWREDTALQIRLDVSLESRHGGEHPHGLRLWQKLSPSDKIQLYQGHPQRPGVPPAFWLVEAEALGAEVSFLNDASRVSRYNLQ